MKMFDYWKIFNFTKRRGNDSTTAKLSHNQITLNELTVLNNKLHKETYRLLRKFKAPQYSTIYGMRGKKGFNTLYFIQNYDVVITDKHGMIIDKFEDLSTGYISSKYENGYSVYFMTVGTIKHYDFKIKDVLKIERLTQWY